MPDLSAKESYLAAQFPDRFKVLFWKLKPFTLGHAMLLDWVASPFITGARAPDRLDCALMLAFCSRSFRAAEKLARSRFLKLHIRRFAVPKFQTQAALVGLIRYAQHFSMSPKCWTNETTGGRLNGAPFLEVVKVTHMAFLHRTEEETLNLPFSLAIHDYAAFWELKDKVKIVSEQEESVMEVVRGLASRN